MGGLGGERGGAVGRERGDGWGGERGEGSQQGQGSGCVGLSFMCFSVEWMNFGENEPVVRNVLSRGSQWDLGSVCQCEECFWQ